MEVERRNRPDAGYCMYGAGILLAQVKRIRGETQGVRDGRDIEYVHRMRVATRRIRAAMPLFTDCYRKKEYRRWQRRLRGLTRALGAARDTDVQIAFLEEFIAAIPDNGPTGVFGALPPAQRSEISGRRGQAGSAGIIKRLKNALQVLRQALLLEEMTEPPLPIQVAQYRGDEARPGLECLLLRLRQQREALQPGVVAALDLIEDEGLIGGMEDRLRSVIVKGRLYQTDVHSRTAFEMAFYGISMRIEEVLGYDEFVPIETAVDRHHAMRIAAKHLRYTMESYDDLFDGALKEAIGKIKRLQDILGDLHDCDVWVTTLPLLEEEERRRSLAYFGHDSFYSLIEPGLEYLRTDRQRKRSELYHDLVTYWTGLKKEQMFVEIRNVISAPLSGLQSASGELSIPAGEGGRVVIALLGDVHANLPALEAVLQDARNRGATSILNTGDFVGYGAFPDEVVTLLRNEHAISVIGNYDQNVLLSGGERTKNRKRKKHLTRDRERLRSILWAYQKLSDENLEYLRSLSTGIRIAVGDRTILLTHGSPDSVTEYIDHDTRKARLRELAATAGADIIVSGHSHRPFAKEVDGVWFVNTGSVGRPDDGDPRASYAILQLNPFALYHFRVPYDVDRAVAAIYDHNLPEAFARIFRDGLPLDIVKHYDEIDRNENES